MSERKYNINNSMNNNENGDEVSGVDRYTRPVWHRYAAIAATFVLLAGGIGGSIALGKHMNKNKNSDDNFIAATTAITTVSTVTTAPENGTEALTATNAQVVTDTTIAELITTAAVSETTASASGRASGASFGAAAVSSLYKDCTSGLVITFPCLNVTRAGGVL